MMMIKIMNAKQCEYTNNQLIVQFKTINMLTFMLFGFYLNLKYLSKKNRDYLSPNRKSEAGVAILGTLGGEDLSVKLMKPDE